MDPATLATTVTALLVPYLAKAGASLADEALKLLPGAVGALWQAISQRFKARPAAEAAANDLTAKPQDKDNQDLFEVQLRKMLKDDPDFAEKLGGLLEQAQASGSITQQGSGAIALDGSVAAGAGGVAIGGSASGNIVLGQENKLTSGRQGGSEGGNTGAPPT